VSEPALLTDPRNPGHLDLSLPDYPEESLRRFLAFPLFATPVPQGTGPEDCDRMSSSRLFCWRSVLMRWCLAVIASLPQGPGKQGLEPIEPVWRSVSVVLDPFELSLACSLIAVHHPCRQVRPLPRTATAAGPEPHTWCRNCTGMAGPNGGLPGKRWEWLAQAVLPPGRSRVWQHGSWPGSGRERLPMISSGDTPVPGLVDSRPNHSPQVTAALSRHFSLPPPGPLL
jgi:hypothetical protein